jgi:hypothetical protein
MLVLPDRFAGLTALDVWWPDGPAEALRVAAPVVRVRQIAEGVASTLERTAFRRRASPTLLIDLNRPEDALWEDLHPKSCRAKVRRAETLGLRVRVNEEPEEATRLVDDYIARVGYRRALTARDWRRVLGHSDVFTIEADGVVCAAHVFLSDTRRVRMLFSATARRTGRDHDRLVGLANRYLHWREIQHYRAQGVQLYDFGGVELDPARPLYSVTQFKLSFGGEVVPEESVYLAANRALRGMLRTASGARLTARRVSDRHRPRDARSA